MMLVVDQKKKKVLHAHVYLQMKTDDIEVCTNIVHSNISNEFNTFVLGLFFCISMERGKEDTHYQ